MSTVNIAALGNAQAIGYADIPISREAAGKLALGNFVINVGQAVGAGQDNYVLTYDDATGEISLEAAASGGDLVSDTTPQLGGSLDVNGNSIVSVANGNIEITPHGTGQIRLGSSLTYVANGVINVPNTLANASKGYAIAGTVCFTQVSSSTAIRALDAGGGVSFVVNGGSTVTGFWGNINNARLALTSAHALAWSNLSNSLTTLDTSLRRSDVSVMQLAGGTAGTGAALEQFEMTAPAAPSANGVRIYAEDNGSGKTRLMALFSTGVAQQVAIEP